MNRSDDLDVASARTHPVCVASASAAAVTSAPDRVSHAKSRRPRDDPRLAIHPKCNQRRSDPIRSDPCLPKSRCSPAMTIAAVSAMLSTAPASVGSGSKSTAAAAAAAAAAVQARPRTTLSTLATRTCPSRWATAAISVGRDAPLRSITRAAKSCKKASSVKHRIARTTGL